MGKQVDGVCRRRRTAGGQLTHVAEARQAWAELQPRLDPARLIFLDETWMTTNMARTLERAPRGERLVASVPHRHWLTTTFLCGLRHDSLWRRWCWTARPYVEFRDDAGKMNGAEFLRGVVAAFPYTSAPTYSIASAMRTASSTSSQSHIIRGPTAKPNG